MGEKGIDRRLVDGVWRTVLREDSTAGGGGGTGDLADNTRLWFQIEDSYDSGQQVVWTNGTSGGDGTFLNTDVGNSPTITEDGVYAFLAYAEIGGHAGKFGQVEITLSNEDGDYPWQKSSSPLDAGVIGSVPLIRRCSAGRQVTIQVFHDVGEAPAMTIWVEVQKILPGGGKWPSNWHGDSGDIGDLAVGTIYEMFGSLGGTLPDGNPGDIVGFFSPGAAVLTLDAPMGFQIDGHSPPFTLNMGPREFLFMQYAEGIGDAWYVMGRQRQIGTELTPRVIGVSHDGSPWDGAPGEFILDFYGADALVVNLPEQPPTGTVFGATSIENPTIIHALDGAFIADYGTGDFTLGTPFASVTLMFVETDDGPDGFGGPPGLWVVTNFYAGLGPP